MNPLSRSTLRRLALAVIALAIVLPGPTEDAQAACRLSKKIVEIGLSSTKHANVLAHAREAGALGYGKMRADSLYPVWRINRIGADWRRRQLLDGPWGRVARIEMGFPAEGIPTKPGFDRDEASPAVLRTRVRAHVAWVPSSENRSAGAIMGNKIRPWCDGQRVRYIAY